MGSNPSGCTTERAGIRPAFSVVSVRDESPGFAQCPVSLAKRRRIVYIPPGVPAKGRSIGSAFSLVSVSDVTTVGDGDNDYEMLVRFGGYAIAGSRVAEHHPELPTVASVASLLQEM